MSASPLRVAEKTCGAFGHPDQSVLQLFVLTPVDSSGNNKLPSKISILLGTLLLVIVTQLIKFFTGRVEGCRLTH